MSREAHVRICGGLVVRFLRSTRHFPSGGSLNVYGEFDDPLIGSAIALAPTINIDAVYHSCEVTPPPFLYNTK
jgi:hypothetical protein